MLHETGDVSLSKIPTDISRLTLVVGPEGGFSDREVEYARRTGATVASLGSGILRTETAAVVGAALVLARYGRLG
jgi:16S rRNA (uracil1498-N3)-methyltransferase